MADIFFNKFLKKFRLMCCSLVIALCKTKVDIRCISYRIGREEGEDGAISTDGLYAVPEVVLVEEWLPILC